MVRFQVTVFVLAFLLVAYFFFLQNITIPTEIIGPERAKKLGKKSLRNLLASSPAIGDIIGILA